MDRIKSHLGPFLSLQGVEAASALLKYQPSDAEGWHPSRQPRLSFQPGPPGAQGEEMQLGLQPGPVALMEQSFMARVAKAQPSQQAAVGKQSCSNRLARQRFRCCTEVQESNTVLRKPWADLFRPW